MKKFFFLLVFVLLTIFSPLISFAGLFVKGTDYDVSVQQTSGQVPSKVLVGSEPESVGYKIRWKGSVKREGEIKIKAAKPRNKSFKKSFSFSADVEDEDGRTYSTKISGDVVTSDVCCWKPVGIKGPNIVKVGNTIELIGKAEPENCADYSKFTWQSIFGGGDGKIYTITPDKTNAGSHQVALKVAEKVFGHKVRVNLKECQNLKKKLQRKKEETKRLQRREKNLRESLKDIPEAKKELKNKIDERKREIEQVESKIDKQQKKIDQERDEIETVENQIDQHEEEFFDGKDYKNLNELESDIKSSKDRFKTAKENLDNTKVLREAKRLEVGSVCTAAGPKGSAQCSKVTEELEQLSDAVDQISLLVETLKQDLENLNSIRRKYETKLKNHKKNLEKEKKELADAKKGLNVLESEKDDLEYANNFSNDRINDLNKQKKNLQDKLSETEEKLRKEKKKMRKIENKYQECKNR